MKTLDVEKTSLQECVNQAQEERLVITRNGRPVALVIGIDQEQLELGQDAEFWKLIEERRGRKTIRRDELEKLLGEEKG